MTMHDELRALDRWLQAEAARIEGMSLPMQAKADGYIAVREKIDAILAEYADWVCVPREPSRALISDIRERMGNTIYPDDCLDIYHAMIHAAKAGDSEPHD